MSRFYKTWTIGNVQITLNRFPRTAKQVDCGEHGSVYRTGLHKWNPSGATNWSVVAGCWRIIVSVAKQIGECCADRQV